MQDEQRDASPLEEGTDHIAHTSQAAYAAAAAAKAGQPQRGRQPERHWQDHWEQL